MFNFQSLASISGTSEAERVGLDQPSEADGPGPEPREGVHQVGDEGRRAVVQRRQGPPEEPQDAAQPSRKVDAETREGISTVSSKPFMS